MLDPQRLRTDLDAVVARLADRGFTFDREAYAHLESERRRVIQEAEALKAERNKVSDEVAKLKREKQDASHLIEQQRAVGEKLKALEHAEKEADAAFQRFLAEVPNTPHASVYQKFQENQDPSKIDAVGNLETKRWGAIPAIEKPLDHVELGTKLGILDLDRAAKLSGARFSVLKGLGAKLERALAAFMLDRQTAAGYTEILPPYLVNAESLRGTGQLPKFKDDLFRVPRRQSGFYSANLLLSGNLEIDVNTVVDGTGSIEISIGDKTLTASQRAEIDRLPILDAVRDLPGVLDALATRLDGSELLREVESRIREFAKMQLSNDPSLYLIPTAEVPVTNLYRDEILDGASLPLRHCAFTPCFRSEAGSHGKDTKGLIRQHQFHKVELVTFSEPDKAEAELERLTADAEAILEALELPYRRVLLCTGDMGFSSQKTYDLEVWIPSQGTYREISSCSWFGDFQARRANLKYRPSEPKAKAQLLHTLNGSGLAVGRTWVALLENHQQPDGSIRVPKALQSYMGCEVIR